MDSKKRIQHGFHIFVGGMLLGMIANPFGWLKIEVDKESFLAIFALLVLVGGFCNMLYLLKKEDNQG